MNALTVKKKYVLLTLAMMLFVVGCIDRPQYGQSLNRDQNAREVAQAEAALNFSCPKMKADARVGKLHEGDAEDGLFSEYLVLVTGCGRSAEYRVSCRSGGLCAVAE